MGSVNLHPGQSQGPLRAKLFERDGHQAVCLPDELRFDGPEVIVRRVEGGILLEPALVKPSRTVDEIREMFAYIDSLDADPIFPEGRDQGVAEERLPIE